jgi:hypothetical protein
MRRAGSKPWTGSTATLSLKTGLTDKGKKDLANFLSILSFRSATR